MYIDQFLFMGHDGDCLLLNKPSVHDEAIPTVLFPLQWHIYNIKQGLHMAFFLV